MTERIQNFRHRSGHSLQPIKLVELSRTESFLDLKNVGSRHKGTYLGHGPLAIEMQEHL